MESRVCPVSCTLGGHTSPSFASSLGQEPPERPQEDVYDGRSLAEVLTEGRAFAVKD